MEEQSKQFPRRSKESKPTTGDLLYNGKVLLSNKPFKYLQHEKTRLILTGYYKKDLFKLRYHYGS